MSKKAKDRRLSARTPDGGVLRWRVAGDGRMSLVIRDTRDPAYVQVADAARQLFLAGATRAACQVLAAAGFVDIAAWEPLKPEKAELPESVRERLLAAPGEAGSR